MHVGSRLSLSSCRDGPAVLEGIGGLSCVEFDRVLASPSLGCTMSAPPGVVTASTAFAPEGEAPSTDRASGGTTCAEGESELLIAVARAVAAAPDLTPAQRSRIAAAFGGVTPSTARTSDEARPIAA